MKKHLTEEEIIDYVLGTLSSDKHFIATRHLKTCHTCQQELSMWQHILEKEYIHIPSPVTKEKLMRETKQRKTRKKPAHPSLQSFCLYSFMEKEQIRNKLQRKMKKLSLLMKIHFIQTSMFNMCMPHNRMNM